MFEATVVGNLTRDPEVKVGKNKEQFLTTTIAVNYPNDEVLFFNCSAFGKTADFIYKYFKKGDKIVVTCRVTPSNYEDKNKVKHETISGVIRSADFCSKKESEVEEPAFN